MSRDCGDCAVDTVTDELGYDYRLVLEGRHDPDQGGYEYDEVPRSGDNRWYLHGYWVEEKPSSDDKSEWCTVTDYELEYAGKALDDDRTELHDYYPLPSDECDSRSYSAAVNAGISWGPFNVGASLSISGDFPCSISFEESWSDESTYSPRWWIGGSTLYPPDVYVGQEEYQDGETYEGGDWVRWDTHTNLAECYTEDVDAWSRHTYRIYEEDNCDRGGDTYYVTTPWAGVRVEYTAVDASTDDDC